MKTIVITGSSSGIGKATARYFAEQGWQVAATMRKPKNESELNRIEGVSLYALDVTDQVSVDSAVEQRAAAGQRYQAGVVANLVPLAGDEEGHLAPTVDGHRAVGNQLLG